MKVIGVGLVTLVVGLIICILLSSIFSSGADTGSSYLGLIGFSILYLASIISICTFFIIKKMDK